MNLNELYKTLIQHLKNMNLDVRKFFFIDAISLTSDKTNTKHDNCIFVSNPNSLIELSLAITQGLNTEKPDLLIFDSLSTLLIYEKESTVTKFIHALIGKIKAAGIDAYFTALEGDSQNESIKDLSMFVDNVNTLTEFELGELGFKIERQSTNRLQPLSIPALQEKSKPFSPELMKHLEENKIVNQEMSNLKNRLTQMQQNKDVTKSLNELKGEIGKNEALKELQKQVKLISEKLEQKKEKPIDKTLLNQINRLEKKIDNAQKKKGKKEKVKYSVELKKVITSLKEKVDKIEKLANLESQVKILSEKLEKKKEKPVDDMMINQITKLSEKIDSLEKKVSKKMKEKKVKKTENAGLKKKLESYKKKAELQSMFNDFYKTDVSKINPEKVMTKQLEHSLDKKNNFLDKAYQKGLVPKKMYTKGKTRIKQETKRLKHAAQIHSLETKLDALNEAYDSGIISKESYFKGKSRIERLVKN